MLVSYVTVSGDSFVAKPAEQEASYTARRLWSVRGIFKTEWYKNILSLKSLDCYKKTKCFTTFALEAPVLDLRLSAYMIYLTKLVLFADFIKSNVYKSQYID